MNVLYKFSYMEEENLSELRVFFNGAEEAPQHIRLDAYGIYWPTESLAQRQERRARQVEEEALARAAAEAYDRRLMEMFSAESSARDEIQELRNEIFRAIDVCVARSTSYNWPNREAFDRLRSEFVRLENNFNDWISSSYDERYSNPNASEITSRALGITDVIRPQIPRCEE